MTSCAAPAISSDDRDDGRRQLVAVRVARTLQVQQNFEAGGTDCDVGCPLAPRASEGVAHDARRARGRSVLAADPQPRPRRRRDRRAEGRASRRGRVRGVDAARGANEAVVRLGDQERAPGADDPLCLAEDHLDLRGSPLRQSHAPRRGLDVVKPHDSALRSSRSPSVRRRGRPVLQLGSLDYEACQVVPFAELRQSAKGEIVRSVTGRRSEDQRDRGSGG